MLNAVIIADDLTGALDTGVCFSDQGISVRVATGIGSDDITRRAIIDRKFDVIVINTRSRHDSPHKAMDRVRRVAESVYQAVDQNERSTSTLVYKKCDSTLRGNIGAELEAMASVFTESAILFVPAFPKLGRTTRAGIQLVHGLPVAESSFGTDAMNPVLLSSLKDIVGQQSRLTVHSISVSAFLADVCSALHPGEITVVDSETETDLSEIATALRRAIDGEINRMPILAGSAGFASHLSEFLEPPALRPRSLQARLFGSNSRLHRPVLAIIGSRHRASQEQADRAVASGFEEIILPMRGEATIAHPDEHSAHQTATVKLAASIDCVVRGPGPGDPEAVRRSMADLVASVLDVVPFFILIVFGGDTSEAILDRVGIEALEPIREFAPGVVFSVAEQSLRSSKETDLLLFTKAGGFGEPNLLLDIARAEKESIQ